MQPSLHIALRQQQVLAPQLRQSLKLLQFTTIELQTAITQALQENIFLELEEPYSDEPVSSLSELERNENIASEVDDPSVNEDWSGLEPKIPQNDISLGAGDTTHILEQIVSEAATLSSYLCTQLMSLHLNAQESACAYAIIDAIDEEGYFTSSTQCIADELGLDLALVACVLEKIQKSVPAGIGASSLQERLLMQLDEKSVSSALMKTTRDMVANYLDLLASKDLKNLTRKLSAPPELIRQSVALIQTLDPHPVAKVVTQAVEAIIPDLFVNKVDGVWVMQLNESIIPRLSINSEYVGQVRLLEKTAKANLQGQLNEAEQFIKGVQNRFETLAQVAKIVVEHQHLFLEHGEAMLKPLNLATIAKKMSVNESTVSRAMSGKYMQTPHGVFELNFFLSHQAANQKMQGADGSDNAKSLSDMAVRAKIRAIVEAEPANHPYNDELIAEKLLEAGIKLARRTVTKHRKAMQIPTSRERKRENQLYTNI